MGGQVILQSGDGEKSFKVDTKVACVAKLIRTMLENLGGGDEDTSIDDRSSPDIIPLYNVTGATLEKVVAWCEQHVNDDTSYLIEDGCQRRLHGFSEWDERFLSDLDFTSLIDLTNAANYLDIKGLLDMTCKKVAYHLKGKNPAEIRSMCGIAERKDRLIIEVD